MTDISKCNGSGCDKRHECWRYIAPSSDRQSWMDAASCFRSTRLGPEQINDHFVQATPEQIARHAKEKTK